METSNHMDDEYINKMLAEYANQVKWLRERVPPDDIYDFAQQLLVAAEYFISVMDEEMELEEAILRDPALDHWIANVLSVEMMKREGFKATINTDWRIKKR
jgi:hypothetical protein